MHAYKCTSCHCELTYIAFTRSQFCNKPVCQRAMVQAQLAMEKHNLAAKLSKRCLVRIKKIRNTQQSNNIPIKLVEEINKSTPIIAMLPANTGKLSKLSNTRKRAFLNHLSDLYDDVRNKNIDAHKVYTQHLEQNLANDETVLLEKGCATCKGKCCGQGETHAFQDYPSLHYFLLQQHVQFSKDRLLDLYSQYLPTTSYRNGCVFQSKSGCTLPKPMRAFTCNNYLCEEQHEYRQAIQHNSGSSITYAAAINKNRIVRSSVFNQQEMFIT